VVGEPEPLTPRELEVLRLMSRGHTNPQIARRLFLAVGTVKVHVEHILGKLAAVDRTDAAVRALHQGLLDDEPGMNERHMPVGR
jgi:NarL family two-component system response regulator LiaR